MGILLIQFLLVLLLWALPSCALRSNNTVASNDSSITIIDSVILPKPKMVDSTALIDTAKRYVGIRELTGKNDGYFIEMFLKSVGRKKGDSYCAAFISYCATKSFVRYPEVRNGLARAFKLPGYIKSIDVYYGAAHVPKGSLVGFENIGTWSGHIEILTKDAKGKALETIGANTSNGLTGSQSDGNGIYARKRNIVPYSGNLRITWFTLVRY